MLWGYLILMQNLLLIFSSDVVLKSTIFLQIT